MKKFNTFLFACILLFGLSSMVNATLLDRGGGLIYDDVLNITWLQDANYAKTSGYDDDGVMTWNIAVEWANNLVYAGYDDWRLPLTVDGFWLEDWSNPNFDGTTFGGYNITTSEMGYMYYKNLDNLARYAVDGTNPQSGWGLNNTFPFYNLEPMTYLSGTEYNLDKNKAWNFVFYEGYQDLDPKSGGYVWAVRNGDSFPLQDHSIPEPTTLLLLGFGLLGVAGVSRKKN